MRSRTALIALVVVALAGCGGEARRVNAPRPAPLITMTAAVHDDVVRVSPAVVGAGQVVVIVSNQSRRPQQVTMETDELGGRQGGTRASSRTIPARGTGRLTLNARTGTYRVRVGDPAIRGARVVVGPPRESGQNRVLLP